jgi:FtsP/CotA-like multicopper oxidase with cupredoxin domain
VIDPLEPEPFAYDRDYVVLLSDWTDLDPKRLFARLKKMPDFDNYYKRTVGDFFARREAARPGRHGRRSQDVGRDADDADRPVGRQRQHLHLPDERHDLARQLDRAVPQGEKVRCASSTARR